MTVTMDSKPEEILNLVPDDTNDRPRGDQSLRADPSNCNLKGKWPKDVGEFARLWAKTEKEDENAYPSIKEVVMGIYFHHIAFVDATYTRLAENMPERL